MLMDFYSFVIATYVDYFYTLLFASCLTDHFIISFIS